MARYTGPKNRLARREGMDLGMKTPGSKSYANLQKRMGIIPGQHGVKNRRKISDYGSQLREKQKVKRMYGVLERQFRKTFKEAKKWKGNTGEKLLEFMERRLDNVVYRMGFSPTRGLSRQLVSHQHVLVDGKRVNIPSYRVEKDIVITLTPKAMEIPAVKKMLDDTTIRPPAWIERKGPVGKVVRLPERTDIGEDINEQLIVEHYSR
jgi:small subunit ribosomal protein S4